MSGMTEAWEDIRNKGYDKPIIIHNMSEQTNASKEPLLPSVFKSLRNTIDNLEVKANDIQGKVSQLNPPPPNPEPNAKMGGHPQVVNSFIDELGLEIERLNRIADRFESIYRQLNRIL